MCVGVHASVIFVCCVMCLDVFVCGCVSTRVCIFVSAGMSVGVCVYLCVGALCVCVCLYVCDVVCVVVPFLRCVCMCVYVDICL